MFTVTFDNQSISAIYEIMQYKNEVNKAVTLYAKEMQKTARDTYFEVEENGVT